MNISINQVPHELPEGATVADAVAALGAAAFAAGAVGFGSSAGRLAFESLVQHDAPERVRGRTFARTFARYETIFQLCWVAGAGIATLVTFHSRGGMRTLALICFGGMALSVYGLARRASASATYEGVLSNEPLR